MRKYYLALLFATGLAASQARASSLFISLDSPVQSGSPGDVLSFTGTITNTTGSSVDLVSDNFDLTDFPPSSLDDSPFFNNTPPTLAGGASTGDVELFDITIPNPFTLPPGDNPYGGTFQVLDDNGAVVGTAFFTVSVQLPPPSVPEPSTAAMLTGSIAVLSLLGAVRRRGRRAS
jgi:hypothetical protein